MLKERVGGKDVLGKEKHKYIKIYHCSKLEKCYT